MRLLNILKGLSDYKVVISLTGYILMMSGYPIIGNALWFLIDMVWYKHYKKIGDETSMAIFIIWAILAGFFTIKYSLIHWGLIV